MSDPTGNAEDMLDAAQDTIADLEAENAKLQAELKKSEDGWNLEITTSTLSKIKNEELQAEKEVMLRALKHTAYYGLDNVAEEVRQVAMNAIKEVECGK